MKKLIVYLLILFPLIASSKTAAITINGISGAVLVNVNKRLEELAHIKPLNQFNPDELGNEIIKAIEPFGYFHAKVSVHLNNPPALSESSAKNLESKSPHPLNVPFLPMTGEKKSFKPVGSRPNLQKILNSMGVIPGESGPNIIISVQLGKQVHITSLSLKLEGEGRNNLLLLNIVKEASNKVGTPFFSEEYNQLKQNMINTAERQGYLHGQFPTAEILIDERHNTAKISLIFNTGPLFYFGQLQFDPTYISPKLLHRFVPFHSGQPYSTDLILKLNDNLATSGYFNSVFVKPQLSQDNDIQVLVHSTPVSKFSHSLSAGYGTDTGVRGRAALNVIPVNSSGHKFNIMGQGSFTQNALQASYVVPGNNPVTDQYGLTGNFSNLNYPTGYSNAYLLSLGQQHNLDNVQRAFSINGLYESFHYGLPITTNQFLLYPKASFTFSKTKNKLYSPSGYNLTFNALGANKFTFSNLTFGQLSVDAKAALYFDSLGLRLYGHTIQGITATDNIKELPLSLALLLGGSDNLKAFGYNSIGPGKILSYAGLEIQKEVKKNWYVLGFYDAGDVFNPSKKNTLYDLGTGLMWVSPVGPIKIGLAQSVNSKLQRVGTNPRLVISIGPDL
jgi:translocation and assembly module TamA